MMKLAVISLTLGASVAHADDLDPLASDDLRPPSSVPMKPRVIEQVHPFATTSLWGGGVRLTGLSGIGALPGVNYGAEFAGHIRYGEYFAELGLGWWKPQQTYIVTETPERVELGLDVWTLRGGWASMQSPLRGWVLVEAGQVAGTSGMPGVAARMVMGDTPNAQRWTAVGAGFGIAWPMSENAQLFGMFEVAVPLHRDDMMLATGAYQPDALAARSSLGLEVGWR
jgi:hypothetical protein